MKRIVTATIALLMLSGLAHAQESATDCDKFAWPYYPRECLAAPDSETAGQPSARFAIASPEPIKHRRRGHLQQLLQAASPVHREKPAEAARLAGDTGDQDQIQPDGTKGGPAIPGLPYTAGG
jgi:hypothetical protein